MTTPPNLTRSFRIVAIFLITCGPRLLLVQQVHFECEDAPRTIASKIYNHYQQRYWIGHAVVCRPGIFSWHDVHLQFSFNPEGEEEDVRCADINHYAYLI